MEKHCEAQYFVTADERQALENVLADCIAVVRVFLRCLHAEVKLRQKLPGDPRFPGFAEKVGPVGHNGLLELVADPLAADPGQSGRKGRRGEKRPGLNIVAQLGAEAHGAHDPESVLREALHGIAHRADETVLEVLSSPEQIDQTVGRAVSHRVDGEVPPLKVLAQVRCESHFLRVTAVLVDAVHPVSCHFIAFSADHHRDCAVFETGVYSPGEDLLDFQRERRCRDIPVVGLSAEKRVSHAAAHHIGLISGRLQFFQYDVCLFRNLNHIFMNHIYISMLFPNKPSLSRVFRSRRIRR